MNDKCKRVPSSIRKMRLRTDEWCSISTLLHGSPNNLVTCGDSYHIIVTIRVTRFWNIKSWALYTLGKLISCTYAWLLFVNYLFFSAILGREKYSTFQLFLEPTELRNSKLCPFFRLDESEVYPIRSLYNIGDMLGRVQRYRIYIYLQFEYGSVDNVLHCN